MSDLTMFQEQVSEHAWTPEKAINAERNSSRQRVLQLLDEGRPGRAQYELARSVIRQARIAGLGTQVIEPVCPCRRVGGCPR